jgi:hypothetical protein
MNSTRNTFVRAIAVVAGLAGGVLAARPAQADDASCVAASESEVGVRKQQKLLDARKLLVVCGDPSCPAIVRTECARRAVGLDAAMPTVVLAASDEAGHDIAAASVTVDGVPFAQTLDGRSLPVDPGSHALRFEAPGKLPVDMTIVVREAEKERHVSAVLRSMGSAAEPPSGEARPGWSAQRKVAVVSAGVGVVGLGVGAVLGALASSEWSTQQSDCKKAGECSDHAGAVSAHSAAETDGAVSTAAIVIGGAALAGGVVLWFTAKAPHEAPTTALHVGPMTASHGGGVLLGGWFE